MAAIDKTTDMHFDEITNELNVMLPLIYMWEIKNGNGKILGCYVGKAKTGARRPRRHYARNVVNFLNDKPYRKNNPKGYRKVHIALAHAEKSRFRITLSFLCNIQPHENINILEKWHINDKNCKGSEPWQLNG